MWRRVDREVTLDWQAELLNGRMEGTAYIYPTENGKLQGRTQFAELSVVELARLADVLPRQGDGDYRRPLHFFRGLVGPG